MHDASALGGFAFTNAWLGIVHSMAHQIGTVYGIPHGCANALLLPNVIHYNSKATNRYNDLAQMRRNYTNLPGLLQRSKNSITGSLIYVVRGGFKTALYYFTITHYTTSLQILNNAEAPAYLHKM